MTIVVDIFGTVPSAKFICCC